MDKQVLANALREISILESNFFKSRNYLNAVRIIEGMSEDEFNRRKSFLDLSGIGPSINTKILDFKNDGTLPSKLFKLREENKSYLDPQLYKVRKGFITKRIPYAQAKALVDDFKSKLSKANSKFIENENMFFLGSYRRQKPLIADIDMLVVGESSYQVLISLINTIDFGFNLEFVVGGPMKTTFVFDNQEKTTIDITWCDKESLPFSLLHFTGSASSNIRLRAKAKTMGYTLNQYGIFPNEEGQSIPELKSEGEIFAFLNELYVEPKNR